AVFKMSGYPRYLEGARYWLHWAGFPESVYSPYGGNDDYKDDYTSRALWVNYLAGGSRVLPDKPGLNVPIDLAFALHSDAGKRADDSIVGTLGIYYTDNGASYKDGTPRTNSRVLTDMVMRQITMDIRRSVEPQWKRRSMWDKSYVEARVPEVPTTLIELLSHQNFGDMQYGLDPRFQFIVGRSIYKAMARFMAERKCREVVIQPLPVKSFAISRVGKGKYRLSWQASIDSLEPTAKPDKYIIFERNGETMGFNKIGESKTTYFDVRVNDNDVHSFKIVAANEGGMSFPSEILALRESEDGNHPVLIVNGFTRVCGPASFVEGGNAGFKSEEDFGVPYIRTYSFSGHQIEFRRTAGDNFGKSSDSYITKVIAGNTFDFVAMHGQSIADAGYGFVSSSIEAVDNSTVRLTDYKSVDLILGKQKMTKLGKGSSGWEFKTFTPKVRQAITDYLNGGGDMLITGQYVASDMSDDKASEEDKRFVSEQLGCTLVQAETIRNPRIDVVSADLSQYIVNDRYTYSNTLNEDFYIVERPDIIAPNASVGAKALMKFTDTDHCAAILKEQGRSKCVVMTVPFESIKDVEQRNRLMMEVLNYFDN
ncbi:MAG: xanthan lyase, partial [Muribaculaceae bacterium]|nr:xanthan lyase [Muribaculaceae bacterium]